MTAKVREGGGSQHTVHQSFGGGGGEKDSQCKQVIGPSWVLHIPGGYSCTEQGLQNIHNLILLFCV
jgi:hypothetical protein